MRRYDHARRTRALALHGPPRRDAIGESAPSTGRLRRLARRLLYSGVTNAPRNTMIPPTTNTEFYTEAKWCESCKSYVRFLMSVNHSYCVTCGGRVRLFNRDDSSRFGETVQRHKWQAS